MRISIEWFRNFYFTMMKKLSFCLCATLLLAACGGNNRSPELSCAVTDKDGQVWYITSYDGDEVVHTDGIVTRIGSETLEATNVFSGVHRGGTYYQGGPYSYIYTLGGKNLVVKAIKRVPNDDTDYIRRYEYDSNDRLQRVVEDMCHMNDDRPVQTNEYEFIWKDDDLVDIIEHEHSVYDGSPYEARVHFIYGTEENPLRSIPACVMCCKAFVALFAETGYYGIGPKHLPVAEERYCRDKLQSSDDIVIHLNNNGTIASESRSGRITCEILYEKAESKK